MIHDIYQFLTHHDFLGIALSRWLSAALITLIGFTIVMSFCRILSRRLLRRLDFSAHPYAGIIVRALESTRPTLVFVFFAAVGSQSLGLEQRHATWLGWLASLMLALQIGLWASAIIRAWAERKLGAEGDQPSNPVVMSMISWLLLVVVWATLLLAVLSVMGVNITAFVASLGVGGVAVALALQNVLGDLFASMSIGLDKPFEIGHFITFGDIAGSIEHVGVKTTRIRSLSGEQVIISNADLLKNTMHNYGRMNQRRIVFAFGVTYDTDRTHLRATPGIVREIIEGLENTRFDRAHFKGFGDSSLDFEVVYYVTNADYTAYMDIQQSINLALIERFDALGVEFAFPSRTLYVAGEVQARVRGLASPKGDAEATPDTSPDPA